MTPRGSHRLLWLSPGWFPNLPSGDGGTGFKGPFCLINPLRAGSLAPSLWPSHVLGMNIRYLWHMS